MKEIGKQLDYVQRQIQEVCWRFSLSVSLSVVLFLLLHFWTALALVLHVSFWPVCRKRQPGSRGQRTWSGAGRPTLMALIHRSRCERRRMHSTATAAGAPRVAVVIRFHLEQSGTVLELPGNSLEQSANSPKQSGNSLAQCWNSAGTVRNSLEQCGNSVRTVRNSF